MARKRMLDSEIWRDKKVVRLSNEAFILWIAIISMSDDEGVFEYDPDAWFYEIARKGLTVSKIRAAMAEIITQKMVVIYGDGYGFIPAWYKHQTLSHPTPSKSKRPSKEILDQYPEYMAAWIKTFTTYRKDENGNRVAIVPEYPYPEPDNTTQDQFQNVPETSGKIQKTPGSIDKISLIQSSLIQSSLDQVSITNPPRAEAAPPEKVDPLYHKIKTTFETVSGRFADYAREGMAIKRIIKFSEGNESTAGRMIETFYNLTKSQDRYWSSQPFLPSILSSGGIWPRVMVEADKAGKVEDVDWYDRCVREIQAEKEAVS